MKKRNVILMSIAVLLILAVSPVMGQGASEDDSVKKVAYIARSLSDPFAAWLATEMENSAEQYSDTFKLDVLDSQGDNERQNSIIETSITKGYDCIIIQPNDGELQRPYAEQIVAAGIECITTNAKIDNIEGSSSVDADPYEQGAVLAEDAVERVPENGKVVILNALPGNHHTVSRDKAFKQEFLAKRKDVELLDETVIQGSSLESEAMATFEDWVQSYPRIDAVFGVGDVLTLAALEVVKNNPAYDDMLAYGVDGLGGALLAIKEGRYTGTCLQDAGELAELNMKAAYELLTDKKEQVDYTIDAVYIDKTNVDSYIDQYVEKGLLSEEDAAKYQ